MDLAVIYVLVLRSDVARSVIYSGIDSLIYYTFLKKWENSLISINIRFKKMQVSVYLLQSNIVHLPIGKRAKSFLTLACHPAANSS